MAAAIFDLNFNILMLLAFFFIAFIYSSVGHGGASGYLSVMALFGIAPFLMKPSALVLNIFVSGVAFWQYYRAGHFRLKLFLPFAAASVPAAFIGGFIPVEPEVYRKTLGASLAVPAIRNFFTINPDKDFSSANANTILSLIAGGAIGLLSGMMA